MISSRIARDTKCIELYGKHYCAYCGEELEAYREIDHYDVTEYYCCECDDAKLELKLQDEIRELKYKISCIEYEFPKERYKITTKTILEEIPGDNKSKNISW